jgi:hypothetical protein
MNGIVRWRVRLLAQKNDAVMQFRVRILPTENCLLSCHDQAKIL